jgi:hypothetical protein
MQMTQNHNFVSLLHSMQERWKTHNADFCRRDWREHKTLHCKTSKTTLVFLMPRRFLCSGFHGSYFSR